MKKFKHLYFDLDRTLWDFDSNSKAALAEVYVEFSLEKYFGNPIEFMEKYNVYNELLWDQYRKGLVKKEVLRSERFRLCLEDKKGWPENLPVLIGEEYLNRSVEKTSLFPNTHETLAYLKERGYQMYILTNGFRETQLSKLKNCNLDGYFLRVFTSETIGINKPNAGIFHWAVSSINAKKDECLIIGDDQEADIEGAHNYGLHAVFFNPHNETLKSHPDHEIRDLSELLLFL